MGARECRLHLGFTELPNIAGGAGFTRAQVHTRFRGKGETQMFYEQDGRPGSVSGLMPTSTLGYAYCPKRKATPGSRFVKSQAALARQEAERNRLRNESTTGGAAGPPRSGSIRSRGAGARTGTGKRRSGTDAPPEPAETPGGTSMAEAEAGAMGAAASADLSGTTRSEPPPRRHRAPRLPPQITTDSLPPNVSQTTIDFGKGTGLAAAQPTLRRSPHDSSRQPKFLGCGKTLKPTRSNQPNSTCNSYCTPPTPYVMENYHKLPGALPATTQKVYLAKPVKNTDPLPPVNLAPMRFTQMKGVPLGADEGLYCRTPRNRHSRNPEKRLFQEENEPHDQIRTSNIPKNTKIVTGYGARKYNIWKPEAESSSVESHRKMLEKNLREEEEAIKRMSLKEVQDELHRLSFGPQHYRQGFCKTHFTNMLHINPYHPAGDRDWTYPCGLAPLD